MLGGDMSQGSAPIQRLPGFPATVARSAPGRLGREGVAGAMLFAAGAGMAGLDLVGRFWLQDAATLDWLEDFLRNPETEQIVRDLQLPEEEEEFEELVFSRAELTTLGSEEIY